MNTSLGQYLNKLEDESLIRNLKLPSKETIAKYCVSIAKNEPPKKRGRPPGRKKIKGVLPKGHINPPLPKKTIFSGKVTWLPFGQFKIKPKFNLNSGRFLTKHQIKIIKNIAFYDKVIGKEIGGLTRRTISNHLQIIYKELGVHSKIELVIYVLQHGLMDINDFELPSYEE